MAEPTDYLFLIPFYANVDYLAAAVRSVLAQSEPGWRLIVIDDSLGDDSARSLVQSFADERIEYLRNSENLGVAGNFNRCFAEARLRGALYATILHSDDVLEPDYVAVVRRAHDRFPAATCIAPNASIIDERGEPSRTLPDSVKAFFWPRRTDILEGEQGLRYLLRAQFYYCPAFSYRMSRLSLPAWNGRWDQVMDLEFYARILLDGGTIALERERVFRYRRHSGSMTTINSWSLVRTVEETELCRELAGEARDKGWNRAARAGRLRLTVRLQAAFRATALLLHGRPSAARKALALAVGR
jgi:glycosyltransferase involved in cell wall biosynthesis